VVAETLYTYNAEATGIPAAEFVLDLAPSNMTVNATNGLVEWTPSAAQFGTNSVSLLASNVVGVATQSYDVVVAGTLPVITSDAVTNVVAEQLYSYDADATGIPSASFMLDLAPSNMTVNATNGLVEWTPSAAQFGSHSVSLLASNVVGVATQNFEIVVDGTVPVIISDAVIKAVAEVPYSYGAEATGIPDPEFSLLMAPTGMIVDAVSGLVNWTPTLNQVGTSTVSVLAFNAVGVATQNFEVIVKEPPETIGINFTGALQSGHKLAAVVESDVMGVEDQIYWNSTGEGAAAGMLANLKSGSGDIHPALSVNWDFYGYGWSQNAVEGMNSPPAAPNVNYNPTNKNHKLMGGLLWDDTPRSMEIWGLQDVFRTNSTYDVIVYTDPVDNGDHTLVTTVNGSSIVIDTVHYSDPGAAFDDATMDHSGNYVRFYGLTGSNLVVTVSPAPDGSIVGSLNGIQIVEIPADPSDVPELIGIDCTGDLTDGNRLAAVVDADVMGVESQTNWNSTGEGVVMGALLGLKGASGVYHSTAVASWIFDNSGWSQNAVEGQNIPPAAPVPVYNPVNKNHKVMGGMLWDLISRSVNVSGLNSVLEPDSTFDVLVYVDPWLGGGATEISIGGESVVVQPLDYNDPGAAFVEASESNEGNYVRFEGLSGSNLTVSVSPGAGGFCFLNGIQIIEVYGVAPVIVSTPPASVIIGESYVYDAEATGNSVPLFELDIAPSGMTVNADSGLLEWTPKNDQLGTNYVSLLASNSTGVATQSFNVVVDGAYAEITSIAPTSVVVGDTYGYTLEATGVPAPQFVLGTAPAGMSFDTFSGLVEWMPLSSQSGQSYVELIATNLLGATTQSFWITVVDVPVIEGISLAGNQIEIDFNHLTTGIQARVERTFILTPPAWTNVGIITPVSTMTNWIETVSNEWTSAFYRIIVEDD
ncbi:Ig domain-containing protein, partial [Pontiellaceae bacterium B12227]|nr:Ig domain-containing protein [Pontiellaceae bacterium B12227]